MSGRSLHGRLHATWLGLALLWAAPGLACAETHQDAPTAADTAALLLTDIEARVDPASRHGAPLPLPPGLPAAAPRQGQVLLLIDVDQRGEVVNLMIERSSRIRQLDVAAIEHARGLRYLPQVLDGVPVGSRLRMLVEFADEARSGT